MRLFPLVLASLVLAAACDSPRDGLPDVPSTDLAQDPGSPPSDPGPGTDTPRDTPVVDTPTGPALVVALDEDGVTTGVDRVDVALYRVTANKPRCQDLDPDALPTAALAVNVALADDARFPDLPDLATQKTQTWTIVALGRVGDGDAVARGCLEGVAVKAGVTKAVTLALHDMPPAVGTLHLRSWLDLRTGLPTEVAQRMDAASMLLTDPARGLLMLACATPVREEVAVSAFCTWTFQVPGAPDMGQLTAVGQAVKSRIEGFWSPEAAPAMTGDAAGDPLTHLSLLSDLACGAGAGPSTEGGCTMTWKALRATWKGRNCATAGCDQTASFTAVPGIDAPLAVPATGRIEPLGATGLLTLDLRDLDVRYAELAHHALERLVMPTAFGNGTDGQPAVDSWEDLVGALLNGRPCLAAGDCCKKFAAAIAAQVNTPGMTEKVLETACRDIATVGAAWLRAGGGDVNEHLVVGSVPGSPCPLVDRTWDGRADSLGTAGDTCRWLFRWTFGESVFEPDATFYGAP